MVVPHIGRTSRSSRGPCSLANRGLRSEAEVPGDGDLASSTSSRCRKLAGSPSVNRVSMLGS